MKAYISLFKMRVLKGLQYKTAAIAGVLTQFFWGIMYIMIFEAFYGSTTNPQPISLTELAQVVWLQQSFLVFIMLWFRDNELITQITSGQIAYELCRPMDIYSFWYAKLIAQRLSAAMLRCLPILLVASLLPAPYKFSLPQDIITFLLFIVTLFLGLLLIVAISMIIYISIFYTMSGAGSMLIFGVFGEFFAGMLIPVPLMPDALRRVVYFLPFRYASDLPFRIYAGNIGANEAIISIGVQILWLSALVFIGRVWIKNALRRIVIQGG